MNGLNTSLKNRKEKITNFNDKTHKMKRKYKKYKTLISILEPVDTVVTIAAITTSVFSSLNFVGLVMVPISAGVVCALRLSDRVLHKIILS